MYPAGLYTSHTTILALSRLPYFALARSPLTCPITPSFPCEGKFWPVLASKSLHCPATSCFALQSHTQPHLPLPCKSHCLPSTAVQSHTLPCSAPNTPCLATHTRPFSPSKRPPDLTARCSTRYREGVVIRGYQDVPGEVKASKAS